MSSAYSTSPPPLVWAKFTDLHLPELSSPHFSYELNHILKSGHRYKERVDCLGRDEAILLVEYLDNALDQLKSSDDTFQMCLSELEGICEKRMILPPSYGIPALPRVVQDSRLGGWGGVSTVPAKREKVVMDDRETRYCLTELKRVKKRFCKVAIKWKRLNHPNVLPIRAFEIKGDGLKLVSDWMFNGNLQEYISKNPDANRVALLSGVAEGLVYLHSHGVIHGALKGTNVVVDTDGIARITDFGLAPLRPRPFEGNWHLEPGTAQEVPKEELPSKALDISSFGMLLIEVFCGREEHVPESLRELMM